MEEDKKDRGERDTIVGSFLFQIYSLNDNRPRIRIRHHRMKRDSPRKERTGEKYRLKKRFLLRNDFIRARPFLHTIRFQNFDNVISVLMTH